MHSVSRSIRAVALLILSNLTGTVAFPQAVKFIRNADSLPLATMSSVRTLCTVDSGDAGLPCYASAASVPAVIPCNPAKPAQLGCAAPSDLVQKDLATMGKTGKKILRARDKVLEILQSENACSEWLKQKDPDPASTFRTLNYALDRHGEETIRAMKDSETQYTYRDPYVASVGQATGAYATVTLNVDGAFFQPLAPMLLFSKEGGPARSRGTRLINIGPYFGDSLSGQTLALLHEFGHVIDLLPLDFENQDGKSVQNTAEVLRYCRAEIDAKGRRGTLQARR